MLISNIPRATTPKYLYLAWLGASNHNHSHCKEGIRKNVRSINFQKSPNFRTIRIIQYHLFLCSYMFFCFFICLTGWNWSWCAVVSQKRRVNAFKVNEPTPGTWKNNFKCLLPDVSHPNKGSWLHRIVLQGLAYTHN